MKYKLINSQTQEKTINQILLNRGVPEERLENFFNLSWDTVQSWQNLDNVNEAIECFVGHLEQGSKIGILIDSDVDGYTSAAILLNWLNYYQSLEDRDLDIEYFFHDSKEHGLDDLIKHFDSSFNLIISPDGGSSDYVSQATLAQKNIDLIVLDHHICDLTSFGSTTIVVNNQLSPKYKNKDLCGAGIVWQFLRGVEETVNYSFVDRYLPFVSLALVADVMSQLSDETRFLTNEGVKIAETLPFFRACLDKMAFSIGDHITPEKCAWYIAPMYNALVRIGSQEEKEFCFKALLDSDATDLIPNETRGHTGEETMLVNEAIRKLNNIKNRQNTQKMKFTEQINDYIVENHIADNQVIFIPIPARDASSFRPLSGLISNQLQDLYQRPAILVFGNADDTEYSGSLRAPSNVPELANFRQFILDSNLLEWAQGHAQAAGLAIKKKNINDFVAYCNQRLSGLDLTSAYDVDFVFDAKDPALSDLIFDLEEYSDIWTTSLDEPLILIDNIEISGKNLVCYEKKTVTLKINLPNGVEMIKFNSSREEYQSFFINDNSDGTMFWRCRAVGKASVNEWHGKKTAQIKIEELEPLEIGLNF